MTVEGSTEDHTRIGQNYSRYALIVAASTGAMYVLTYADVFRIEHVKFGQARLYTALLMGAAVAIVVLAVMWGRTYTLLVKNVAILVGAVLVGGLALSMLRTQALVGDVDYMRGLIPNHSTAIQSSETATFQDVRVQAFADRIVSSHTSDITLMDWLINDIRANGVATTVEAARARPAPTFDLG